MKSLFSLTGEARLIWQTSGPTPEPTPLKQQRELKEAIIASPLKSEELGKELKKAVQDAELKQEEVLRVVGKMQEKLGKFVPAHLRTQRAMAEFGYELGWLSLDDLQKIGVREAAPKPKEEPPLHPDIIAVRYAGVRLDEVNGRYVAVSRGMAQPIDLGVLAAQLRNASSPGAVYIAWETMYDLMSELKKENEKKRSVDIGTAMAALKPAYEELERKVARIRGSVRTDADLLDWGTMELNNRSVRQKLMDTDERKRVQAYTKLVEMGIHDVWYNDATGIFQITAVDYKQLRRTLLNRNDGRGIPDRVDPPEITRLAAPTPTSMPYIEPVVLPSTSIPQKPSSTNYPKGYKPGPRENATNELNRLAENDEERRLAQEYTVLKGTTLETLFPKMQRSGRHTKQFNEQRALEATLDRRWKGIPQTFPNREARISHMRSVIDEIASTRNALLRIENALGGDPRLK